MPISQEPLPSDAEEAEDHDQWKIGINAQLSALRALCVVAVFAILCYTLYRIAELYAPVR